MALAAGMSQDSSLKVSELMEQAFVMDAAAVFRVGPGRQALPTTDFRLHTSLIDDWEEQGVSAVSHPSGVFDADIYTGHIKMLALWNSFIADNHHRLIRLDKPESFDQVRASGKIGVSIGTHHADIFRSLDDVNYFYELGLRSCILVLFGQNRLGTAVDVPDRGGLSGWGKHVIRRMNEVGMAVDVSHCNNETRLGAIESSEKPVFFSHANPLGVCKNVRNVTDDVIRAMAERGGVLGVMPIRMMVSDDEPTTLDDYIDHIAYICDLVGPEFVGIGTEAPIEGFDTLAPEHQIPLPSYMRNEGVQRKLDLPELYGNGRFYLLTEHFVRRGFSDGDICKILGDNFERALREIMTVDKIEEADQAFGGAGADLSYLKISTAGKP